MFNAVSVAFFRDHLHNSHRAVGTPYCQLGQTGQSIAVLIWEPWVCETAVPEPVAVLRMFLYCRVLVSSYRVLWLPVVPLIVDSMERGREELR